MGTVRNDSVVALSNRTITFLAEVFYGGTGPTHREIQFIWDLNGAGAYLPPEEEATKRDRVLYGLRHLRDGRAGDGARADLAQDEDRLHLVAGELAAKIIEDDPAQEDAVANESFAPRSIASFVRYTGPRYPTTPLRRICQSFFPKPPPAHSSHSPIPLATPAS